MARFIFDTGVSGVSGVLIVRQTSQAGGPSPAHITRLRRGDRVRARTDICHTHLSVALIMKGEEGTVESAYRTTQKAKIRWDGGLVFLCRVNELEVIDLRSTRNRNSRLSFCSSAPEWRRDACGQLLADRKRCARLYAQCACSRNADPSHSTARLCADCQNVSYSFVSGVSG